jgi:hypothetical protein
MYTQSNPSPRYKLLAGLYSTMHSDGAIEHADGFSSKLKAADVFIGKSLLRHIYQVRKLAIACNAKTAIDYGCGKASLYITDNFSKTFGSQYQSINEFWGVSKITLYDPGVPAYSERPGEPSDGLICTDVLEHIPEEDIDWVLDECFGLARHFVYMSIASYPAQKLLPNGWNAHLTIKPPNWWKAKFDRASARWAGKMYQIDIESPWRGVFGKVKRKLTSQPYRVKSLHFSR